MVSKSFFSGSCGYSNQTNYLFASSEDFKDPKEKAMWKRKRFIFFGLFLLVLIYFTVKWEIWLAGSRQISVLTWPGIYETWSDKFMTTRCPNNCSGNSIDECDAKHQTFCRCKPGFAGYDCSLELCTKCRLPDLLVIGVQKGGTTAIAQYLSRHPRFLAPNPRKDHFFDEHWYEGFLWYFGLWRIPKELYRPEEIHALESMDYEVNNDDDEETDLEEEKEEEENENKGPDGYGESDEEEEIEEEVEYDETEQNGIAAGYRAKIKFGGSPQYLVNDIAMRRLYAFHPWVKMVVLLRDPTSRTYSAGMMNSFKGALHLSKEELASETKVNNEITTLARNVVYNLEQCLKEARKRRSTPFFRELISVEVELLAVERGTDIEAVYEFYACMSNSSPLMISYEAASRYFVGVDDLGINQYSSPSEDQPTIVVFPNHYIIVKSMYYHQLSVWFTFFPRDQFKIIDSNDLRSDPGKMIGDIEFWMGSIKGNDEIYEYPKGQLELRNTARAPYTIPEETKVFLDNFYRPYNAKLFKLLAREHHKGFRH